jgi:hypothetical protein
MAGGPGGFGSDLLLVLIRNCKGKEGRGQKNKETLIKPRLGFKNATKP